MKARSPTVSGPALLLAGIVLVAFNLRFAITSVGPVVDDIRADLGLSGAEAGLLTAAPLLALGLVSPAAPGLGRRFGVERLVVACMLAIAAGVALRSVGAVAPLFAGTIVAACGIAIGNVMVPGIVKARYADRAPVMMGIYSGALSGGAALATGLTVPLMHASGGSWSTALGLWAVPALVAAAVWAPQVRRAGREPALAARARVTLWRDPLAWRVTMLVGLQSMLFYIVVAWLPDILRDHGIRAATAGLFTAIGLIVGIVASPLLSWLASRRPDQRGVVLLAIVATAIGLAGVQAAPSSTAPLWVVILGFGQGGIFALAMTLIVLRSPDAAHAAQLSGMTQSVGYTLAACGPLAIGALHDLSGGWDLPLIVALVLVIPELWAGLGAARPGLVATVARGADTPAGRCGLFLRLGGTVYTQLPVYRPTPRPRRLRGGHVAVHREHGCGVGVRGEAA